MKPFKRHHYFLFSAILAGFFLGAVAIFLIQRIPTAELTGVGVGNRMQHDAEIALQFDMPVARSVSVTIEPEVFGEIRFEDMIVGHHLARRVVFQPAVTWQPGVEYMVHVSGVRSALFPYGDEHEQLITFTTESEPDVSIVTPSQDGEIRSDAEWRIALDRPNLGNFNFYFHFDPSVEVESSLSEDRGSYRIKPAGLLSQGQQYALTIEREPIRFLYNTEEVAFRGEPETVWQGSWNVRKAPGIESFSPQGDQVATTADLSITFDENIDLASFRESVQVEPAVGGSWTTADYRTITLSPAALEQAVTYTVKLAAGLETFGGGYLEEEAAYSFSTIGPAALDRSSPAAGDTGFNVNGAMRLTFDQEVDHASAQEHFSISPPVAGTFSWDGLTMIFQPTAMLSFNTEYAITLTSGIAAPEGVHSQQTYTIPFTTELSVTKLSVAFHRQEHSLSCEVATLVMALQYRGLSVSEAQLIDAIGFDPTPKEGGVWGNPHIAFVGDIDGRQPTTGYGVYWQPVAQAAQAYRSARWFTDWSITDLTAEIQKGNPVIVWGTAGSGSRIDWKTPEGGNVVAINGEHTYLVIGFMGSASNPTKVIVLDPLSGERYFTLSSFLSNWGLLNRSGVVVE
ncbi:MAG: Ig-like domain-containing protein [Patescibacteria group bacterium]